MVVDGVTPFVVHNARWLSTFWLLGYTIGFFQLIRARPVWFGCRQLPQWPSWQEFRPCGRPEVMRWLGPSSPSCTGNPQEA